MNNLHKKSTTKQGDNSSRLTEEKVREIAREEIDKDNKKKGKMLRHILRIHVGLPLSDMVFASAFKVYTGFSSRRFTSDMREVDDGCQPSWGRNFMMPSPVHHPPISGG